MTNQTLIHERVSEARNRQNPRVIGRMKSGWAVVGDRQIVYGYSLLLPDPVVPSLNDLNDPDRAQFLLDMASLGDALLSVTDAYRINYEILGNSERSLHAHLFPRYEAEPEEFKVHPVWYYDWSEALPMEAGEQTQFIRIMKDELDRMSALLDVGI